MLPSHPSGTEGRIALELALEAPEYDEDEQLTKIPLESPPRFFTSKRIAGGVYVLSLEFTSHAVNKELSSSTYTIIVGEMYSLF